MSDTEERVRSIVKRVAGLPDGFSPTADLHRDLGMKSMAALDLLLSLEEEFGVSISDDAFAETRNLEAIVALVDSMRATFSQPSDARSDGRGSHARD